ncbi:MAG: Stf0 family sulfotransferase [Parasphingopyxis sp.]|uniref:Stf0 family sulfotransferase n=1 Tax=Parasphingopyxis sp. TaxID=1920299 RepID=UPI003F9F21BE
MNALETLERIAPLDCREVRKQLLLPVDRIRYRLASERVFVMLFAARAGSTYAGQLLSNHPEMSKTVEWCNPKRLIRTRRSKGLADDGLALQWSLDRQKERIFGLECTLVGITSCALLGFLDQILPHAQFIILRRRDTVAQAVSIRKGRLSGRYSSLQKSYRNICDDDFDYDAIAHHKAIVEKIYATHERLLAELGIEAETYYYEDVVADPAQFQQAIYSGLGLAHHHGISTQTRFSKIADDINRAWIARFKQMERDRF